MNLNIFLSIFGLDPENFTDGLIEPIRIEKGYLFELNEARRKDINCPICSSTKQHVNQHYLMECKSSINSEENYLLRIHRIQYVCTECGKAFTIPLKGIQPHCLMTNHVIELMTLELRKVKTFKEIADTYHCTTARVIQLFDKKYPYVGRGKLTDIICMDEIKFKSEYGKYACILYSYDNKEIIDVLPSRQKPYLDEYFSKISEKERKNVKYFVSDMYEGFEYVHKKFFHDSIYIVDLFHVVKLLTAAVNSSRTSVMKNIGNTKNKEYKFMKSQWKMFLCRRKDISDKYFKTKDDLKETHFSDMVFNCLELNQSFLEGYNTLQDLMDYNHKRNYQEAVQFITFIFERLINNENPIFQTVGYTYKHYVNEIANCFAKTQNDKRITNSVAENLNNHIKTLVKIAYGYTNFDRFRRRILLINIKGSEKKK